MAPTIRIWIIFLTSLERPILFEIPYVTIVAFQVDDMNPVMIFIVSFQYDKKIIFAESKGILVGCLKIVQRS